MMASNLITKASMLAEFFFALAMLWREGLRANPPPAVQLPAAPCSGGWLNV